MILVVLKSSTERDDLSNPGGGYLPFCAGAHHFWAKLEGSALQGPWNLVFFLFLSWDKSCVGLLCGAHSQPFMMDPSF
jgi:hypothetical protein